MQEAQKFTHPTTPSTERPPEKNLCRRLAFPRDVRLPRDPSRRRRRSRRPCHRLHLRFLAGRKIAEERAGKKTTYSYDALGRVAQTQVADCGIHCTDRDFLDQIVAERKEDAQGNLLAQERYTYDAAGNRTTILKEVDGQASQDQFRYDLFGRLTLHIDPRGAETTVAYNAQFLNASGERVQQKSTTDPEESRSLRPTTPEASSPTRKSTALPENS